MLARLLGIRAEDRRDAAFAFATFAAILLAHSMLETARDTLFLGRLSPDKLPFSYIAIAAATLLGARLNQAAAARCARRKLLAATLLLGGIVTTLLYQVVATSTSPLALIGFYVWVGVLSTVLVVQFWLHMGDAFDIAQAKRMFAVIGAGGLVGATAGSAAASALLSFVEAPTLLLVAAGVLVAASALPLCLPAPLELEPRRAAKAAAQPQTSSLRMVTRDGYLRRLFLIVLVGAVLTTGVDYVFKAKVVAAIEYDGRDLGVFLARFYALVNAISLVVQLVIAPRLLRAIGVSRALLLMPVLMLVGALGFSLTIALLPALMLRATDGTLRHSVHQTASEILYLPLTRHQRERFKAMAETLGRRGGQALASVLILGASWYGLNANVIGFALVALAAIWIATIVGVQPLYLELFRKQLRAGTLETKVDIPALDLASFEALVSALSSEHDSEVIASLDMLDSYGKTELVPALILYHPSREVVLRAFELFAQSRRPDVRRLTDRLLHHDDDDIRAAALRTAVLFAPDATMLRGHLEARSPAIRSTALVALIREGLISKREANEHLRKMVERGDTATRRALAGALRHLEASEFDWVSEELLALPDPLLGAAVAASLATRPDQRHIPLFISLLERRNTRRPARLALLALGPSALEAMATALQSPQTNGRLRRHLPRSISRFGTSRAAAILVATLTTERDERIERKCLRGLGRMRSDDPSLPVDRKALLAAAKRTLQDAITALDWRLTVGRMVAWRQETATAGSELLIAFLEQKSTAALERVFRFCHVLDPRQDYRLLHTAFKGSNRQARATSLELLSHVAPDSLKEGMLAMASEEPPRQRLQQALAYHLPKHHAAFAEAFAKVRGSETPLGALAQAQARDPREHELRMLTKRYADTLRAMLEDPSELLRGIVAYHVRELGLETLGSELGSTMNAPRAAAQLEATPATETLSHAT